MKTLLSFLMVAMLFCATTLHAQKQYTVDGQTYSLTTEVEGPLTLLWSIIDGEYRYFSMKDGEIVELTNTRGTDGYNEEYKQVLSQQTTNTSVDTDKVKLTLGNLRKFFNNYNTQVDPSFQDGTSSIALKLRLGLFAGVSNIVYSDNTTNALLPVAGVDLEVIDEVKLKRHSLVLRFKQLFENSEYAFNSSQVSLNYRFKFVRSQTVDVFANLKFVSYTHVNREVTVMVNQQTMIEEVSGGDFQTPVSFGLGADIALGNGFITLNYNDIFGLGIESNGEFPVDFTIGYKFNL